METKSVKSFMTYATKLTVASFPFSTTVRDDKKLLKTIVNKLDLEMKHEKFKHFSSHIAPSPRVNLQNIKLSLGICQALNGKPLTAKVNGKAFDVPQNL